MTATDSPLTKPAPPSGTFNLWIDGEENPDAFEPGVRQRWGEFRFGAERCVVCSEGPVLAATLGVDAASPRRLFGIPVELPKNRRRHLITIGWSRGSMKVYLDSKVLTEVHVTFLLWSASVSAVVFGHHWA